MTPDLDPAFCPPELLQPVLDLARTDDAGALRRLDELIREHPLDARLHFLRGSLLAGIREYEQARVSMGRAVEIAPDYAVARFQLGLLELSSGDATAADRTLQPLQALPDSEAFHWFARGLALLIRDELDQAVEALEQGIARNNDNPAINSDMRLIIRGVRDRPKTEGDQAEPTSSAHWLLQQYAAKPTKH